MGLEELTRNAVHVLPEGGLERKLELGRPLRVKLGIDVTAPDVTLGNGIPLRRMRALADEADVELGGTDQLYNLLMGRDVMEAYGLEPQVALSVEYLDSWDGTGMSASRGNYIGLKEAPEEQFGKTMRIPDSLLPQWYRLVLESDDDPLSGDPLEGKLALARFVVGRAH